MNLLGKGKRGCPFRPPLSKKNTSRLTLNRDIETIVLQLEQAEDGFTSTTLWRANVDCLY